VKRIRKITKEHQRSTHNIAIIDNSFTYGVITKPSTPIKNVIQNRYAVFDNSSNTKSKNNVLKNIIENNKKNISRFSHKTKH
jgi:hypothetical protein